MSGVTSLNTGAGALTGDIALNSSQPGLLGISSSPSSPYTVTFAPINAQVNQLNGKLGNVVLASPDNTLLFSPTALGATINVSGYVPSGSGGAGSALLQAQNLTGASPLAWSASAAEPPISTVAYAPGAVVKYSGTTFVCLVAQPVGSALPVDGTDWQSIGGGGAGGGNWSYKGAWSASNAYVVNDVVFDSSPTATVDANVIGYIASSNIPASSDAPYTTAGQTAGWQPYFNTFLLGFNNGSSASNPTYTSVISMSGVGGAPPPAGSNGAYIWAVENNDTGPGYGDFCAGRFVVAGLNSGLTPSGTNTLPFITTTHNGGANIQLSINGGGEEPVNVVGGLTVNGVPVATGGNWSFLGNFNTTVATAYALNDVVFDSVNTTQTYICILGYTTTVPTPTAPSANATNWLLFATQGGGSGATITGDAGGSVATNSTGNITMSVSPTAQTGVLTTATTIVLPPAGTGSGITLTGDAGGSVATNSTGNISVSVSATPQSGVLTTANTMVLPPAGAGGGGNWSFLGNFNTTVATAYAINDVVFDSVNPTHTYICILGYTTTVPTPTAPSANATNWLLLATQGAGGGGNWSFRGNFNTTFSQAYAINDVVFDSLIPTDTYICILGYTTATPYPTAPSANATNWLLLARQGGGPLITTGASGSTLSINSTGSLTYTTTAGATSTNNINLATTYNAFGGAAATAGNIEINCCAGAGIISITNEGEILISADTGGVINENINNITLSTTTSPSYSAGGIIKLDADKVLDLVVGSGTATLQTVSGSSEPSLLITPGQGAFAYAGGGALYNCGTFSGTAGYGKASVVQEGSVSYIALNNVAPPVPPATANPNPSADSTNWLPIGGGGGGSGATLTGSAAGSVATNSTGNINVSVSPTAQTGVLTTATTMVLPPVGNLLYRGLWSAGGAYAINDVALFGGNNWVCLVVTTAGESPITTPASWRELGTVSTGQNGANPTSMVQGIIPQNTSAGLLGVSLWATGTNYMKGNTVVDDDSGGMYQSHTNGNTAHKPSTDNGTNWSYLGVAPQIQNNLITSGSNVPGNYSSSTVTFPSAGAVNALDFGDVLVGLSPTLGSYGGCQYTFNGFSSLTWGQTSGAAQIIGVQLFDSGTSNTHSYSAPVFFDTPLALTTGGGTTPVATPHFSVNIITPIVSPSGQQAYSLAYITGTGDTVDTVDNFVTGAGSYIFSGSTSNITF